MLECLIIGDSIAVGTAKARPECVSYARGGWNSQQWNRDYLAKASKSPAKTVIISLGANDHAGVRSIWELQTMRKSITADRVFWIDPGSDRKPLAHDAIIMLAREYGDTVLPRPKAHMSADGIHPTGSGYRELAEKTK